jgi:hypothetical protein
MHSARASPSVRASNRQSAHVTQSDAQVAPARSNSALPASRPCQAPPAPAPLSSQAAALWSGAAGHAPAAHEQPSKPPSKRSLRLLGNEKHEFEQAAQRLYQTEAGRKTLAAAEVKGVTIELDTSRKTGVSADANTVHWNPSQHASELQSALAATTRATAQGSNSIMGDSTETEDSNSHTRAKSKAPNSTTDLSGLKFEGGDVNEFLKARDHLMDSARGRKLVQEAARQKILVRANHEGYNAADRLNDIVNWDPRLGMVFDGGKRQSPTLGLAHELSHLVEVSDAEGERLGQIPLTDNMSDAEERRVIEGAEREVALDLNEDVRSSHAAEGNFIAADSTSTRGTQPIQLATEAAEKKILDENNRVRNRGT